MPPPALLSQRRFCLRTPRVARRGTDDHAAVRSIVVGSASVTPTHVVITAAADKDDGTRSTALGRQGRFSSFRALSLDKLRDTSRERPLHRTGLSGKTRTVDIHRTHGGGDRSPLCVAPAQRPSDVGVEGRHLVGIEHDTLVRRVLHVLGPFPGLEWKYFDVDAIAIWSGESKPPHHARVPFASRGIAVEAVQAHQDGLVPFVAREGGAH